MTPKPVHLYSEKKKSEEILPQGSKKLWVMDSNGRIAPDRNLNRGVPGYFGETQEPSAKKCGCFA
jgi:hypothetical protein